LVWRKKDLNAWHRLISANMTFNAMDKQDLSRQGGFHDRALASGPCMVVLHSDSHQTKKILNRMSSKPVQSDFRKVVECEVEKQNCIQISNKVDSFGEELAASDRIGLSVCDPEPISRNRESDRQKVEAK
jgi:hypothetical protein